MYLVIYEKLRYLQKKIRVVLMGWVSLDIYIFFCDLPLEKVNLFNFI